MHYVRVCRVARRNINEHCTALRCIQMLVAMSRMRSSSWLMVDACLRPCSDSNKRCITATIDRHAQSLNIANYQMNEWTNDQSDFHTIQRIQSNSN